MSIFLMLMMLETVVIVQDDVLSELAVHVLFNLDVFDEVNVDCVLSICILLMSPLRWSVVNIDQTRCCCWPQTPLLLLLMSLTAALNHLLKDSCNPSCWPPKVVDENCCVEPRGQCWLPTSILPKLEDEVCCARCRCLVLDVDANFADVAPQTRARFDVLLSLPELCRSCDPIEWHWKPSDDFCDSAADLLLFDRRCTMTWKAYASMSELPFQLHWRIRNFETLSGIHSWSETFSSSVEMLNRDFELTSKSISAMILTHWLRVKGSVLGTLPLKKWSFEKRLSDQPWFLKWWRTALWPCCWRCALPSSNRRNWIACWWRASRPTMGFTTSPQWER